MFFNPGPKEKTKMIKEEEKKKDKEGHREHNCKKKKKKGKEWVNDKKILKIPESKNHIQFSPS